jgi:hypothetical protein
VGRLGHLGGRASPGDEIPLGLKLRIALEDEAAGDAELLGKPPRRGKTFARREAPGPDRVTQLALKLDAHRLGAVALDAERQLRSQTGPLNRHEIGSYR